MKTPNYYAVIPADVRYDDNLKPNEKLIFGEITALATKDGYCWANNHYFAQLYKISNETISRWIGRLEKYSYLIRELLYDENKQIIGRKLFINCMREGANGEAFVLPKLAHKKGHRGKSHNEANREACGDKKSELNHDVKHDIQGCADEGQLIKPVDGEINGSSSVSDYTPIDDFVNTLMTFSSIPIDEKVKDNITSINITSINKKNNTSVPFQKQVFEYWTYKSEDEKALVNHTKYSDTIERAINKATKVYGKDIDHFKLLIDRFISCFNQAKDSDYPIRSRPIYEFFGQKVKDGVILICQEYDDDGSKWLRAENMPRKRKTLYDD